MATSLSNPLFTMMLLLIAISLNITNSFQMMPNNGIKMIVHSAHQKPIDDVVVYNDDAFGLIFLTASFVENDILFASTFGVLSGIAAIVVRNGVVPLDPFLLPGAVAAIAFALARGVHISQGGYFWKDVSMLEVAVCAVSIIWGLWQQQQQKES